MDTPVAVLPSLMRPSPAQIGELELVVVALATPRAEPYGTVASFNRVPAPLDEHLDALMTVVLPLRPA
jgi:hypothetical protein